MLKRIIEKIKKLAVIDWIILFSAFVTFVLYTFYFMGGTFLADSGGLFVLTFVYLGTTVPIIFSGIFKKLLKKAYPILKTIYCTCLLFYVLSFAVFSAVVISDSEREIEYDDRQTVVLVCGCKVNGSYPSLTLKYRLDRAIEILNEKSDALCIVSGGQGDDEAYTEASVMRNYLLKKGIEDERILLEDRSRNTVENIKYSIEILEENEIGKDCNLICVSTDLHTSRVAMIARDNGMHAQVASSDSPYFYLYMASLVREYMSYAKYFIMG